MIWHRLRGNTGPTNRFPVGIGEADTEEAWRGILLSVPAKANASELEHLGSQGVKASHCGKTSTFRAGLQTSMVGGKRWDWRLERDVSSCVVKETRDD